MGSCERILPRIHRLAEDECSRQEAKKLREHLEQCKHCEKVFQEFSRLKRTLEESLNNKITLADDSIFAARAMDAGAQSRRKSFIGRLVKMTLIGAAACMGVVLLSAYLFVHFYFQKTFSHELKASVVRCSDGIEISSRGDGWRPLRAGDRLRKGTSIRTSAGARSFMSFDGIRLLADGEAEFEVGGRRAFSLSKGELVVEAARKKRKPLNVELGRASVRSDGGVFHIVRAESGYSLGVASGAVGVTMPNGTTHRLIADQTVVFGDAQATLDVIHNEVVDPFARLRTRTIDRIKRRFAEVMSRYIPDYKMTRRVIGPMGGAQILEMWNRPEGMYRFASYTPASAFRLAQAWSETSGEYYESLFVPTNRMISIGRQRVVPVSPGMAATFPRWSHDGTMIAFIETYPGALTGRARVVRLDDLDNPWDISQEFDGAVRSMLPPTWAPDSRHVLFQVETGPNWDERGTTSNFKIKIAPIDPAEGPLRDYQSPFYDIPLPLPLPVGKNISPGIERLPWGDALSVSNWGNLAYIPVEEDGQAVEGAPGLFLTDFSPRECFVMGGGFSPSGSMMNFTGVPNFDFNHMQSYLVYDAEDILDGFAPPPRSLDDPRIRLIAPSENMQFTGGFSFDESLVFFHEDVNHAFNAMRPTFIFECDFDIFYTSALPGEPGEVIQLHQPGNQMFLTQSPEGNRISYCDLGQRTQELRIVSFDVEAEMDMDLGGVLIDNSGTNLIVPPGTLEDNFKVKMSTPFSIGEEAELTEGERTFFAMRLIDAQGLENPKFIEPMTLTIRYTDDEVAGLDEGMLEIYYYDESDPENPVWVALGGTVDPDHNEITVEIQHFSKFSVGGKTPEGGRTASAKPHPGKRQAQ